jgi:hypothetical protein
MAARGEWNDCIMEYRGMEGKVAMGISIASYLPFLYHYEGFAGRTALPYQQKGLTVLGVARRVVGHTLSASSFCMRSVWTRL